MLNERSFEVDSLKVNSQFTLGTGVTLPNAVLSGAVKTISPVTDGTLPPVSQLAGQLIYAYYPTAGTPWLQPSANALVKIMDKFTLPANTLTAGRILRFMIYGIHTGANTNVCTTTINIAGTGAVAATITGGTTAVTFNAIISGAPFFVGADIYCQAPATLSRCYGYSNGGATAQLLPIDTALTTDWTAAQAINLTLNNVTTATDSSHYGWTVQLI